MLLENDMRQQSICRQDELEAQPARAISEVTRRDIFDGLRLGQFSWSGQLSESAFLTRIFDLEALPSHDHRCSTMLADVTLHREHFSDWGGEDWVYDDSRLDLLRCNDEVLLRFLCEMIHPVVRPDEAEVDKLLELFNLNLRADGYQLAVKATISGKRIFAGIKAIHPAGAITVNARRVADSLASDHVAAQITRMESSIDSDPSLAIGSAKEFVESICKGTLRERDVALTGVEDLPKLVRMTREAVGLSIDRSTDETLKRTLSALATITQGLAELRGQLGTGHGADPAAPRPPSEVAGLAVRMATALGIFLYERHRNSAPVSTGEM